MKTHIINSFKLTIAATFISILFISLTPCHALEVNLAWKACPGATGYKIHYKKGCHKNHFDRDYDGTGAKIDTDSLAVDSPIDVGNLTQATIHLPDGAYHIAVTAYNEYGESAYGTDYCTCKIQKVKAARDLCANLLASYSEFIKNPGMYSLDSLVLDAEADFFSRWEEAEAMASITGAVCPTASMESIADTIILAVQDLVQQIVDGLYLEYYGGRGLCYYLLREIGIRYAGSFENKTDDTFYMRWNQIIAWAWQSEVIYAGPQNIDIEAKIDDLVTNVLTDIL